MMDQWWMWVAAGIGFGILEVIVPYFFFFGFASGAIIVGGLVALGLDLDLPPLLLIFSVLSLLSWIALRRAVGFRKGQVRKVDHDINED